MGFLGILATIPSTQWLRCVRAFTLTELPTREPIGFFVLFPFSDSPAKLLREIQSKQLYLFDYGEVGAMASELRKTGINVVGDLRWGAHFCYFYETKQDLLDILIPYFKTGLENKEFCLWVISSSELLTVEEATSALRNALPDIDHHVAERSIEIVGHDDWFLKEDVFDPNEVSNRFKNKLNEALDRGYAGMRVNGSPAWLLDAGQEELRTFEAELASLFPRERIIASCTYPLATIRGDEIFDVVRTHQFAIARRQGEWEIIETPELIQAKAEITSLNEELEQRVIERTKELRATNQELRREITERNRAEERLRATSEQLRKLSASLQSAIEEERTHIARELHDELGSALTSLRWGLDEIGGMLSSTRSSAEIAKVPPKIATLTTLIDATFETVRRISSELRPGILDEAGLVAAIEWAAKQFESRTGIICRFESSVENVHLSREQSTAIFRIFQEALTNILRHAQATRVETTIKEAAGKFVLTIIDNGRGLTASELSGSESLGLLGMRERAHLIGGEITIKGTEGLGTVITVRVPLDHQTTIRSAGRG
jgi:signal transduction histidine kinase